MTMHKQQNETPPATSFIVDFGSTPSIYTIGSRSTIASRTSSPSPKASCEISFLPQFEEDYSSSSSIYSSYPSSPCIDKPPYYPWPIYTKFRRKRRIINFVLSIKLYGLILFLLISALIPINWPRNYKGSGIDYPIPATQLDRQFIARNNGNSFDVVVSMYKEDLGAISDFIHNLRLLKQFQKRVELDFRVFIYIKNEIYLNYSTPTSMANTTVSPYPPIKLPMLSVPGVNVTTVPLPNFGREGHTYLHHILTNFDTLANHTLFTQAITHDPSQTLHRISTSFSPQFTGFLGLAMLSVLCSVSSCQDPWGWSDTFSHMPQIYSSVYGTLPEEHRDIQLQYKGQFIASARRIRGIRKSVYEGWKALLEEEESSWVHRDQRWCQVAKGIAKGNWDRKSNPAIGHTLERSWGLLMQCAVREHGITERCGGPHSGGSRRKELSGLKDCQCLDWDDEIVGEEGWKGETSFRENNSKMVQLVHKQDEKMIDNDDIWRESSENQIIELIEYIP